MKKTLAVTGLVACCLLFAGGYLYQNFKPGYAYENGTWNYVSYDEAVGRRVSPIHVDKDHFKHLIHADPNSFEVLKFPYAKDKNDAYCGNLPLYVDDVSKFEVVEGSAFSISSTVNSFFGTDFVDSSSDQARNKQEYNRKKYGFISSPVFFSEDGVAKTDKLLYNGYRLVTDTR